MTINFHKNNDIDEFYMPRKLSGRGIEEIMTACECRIVSTKQHLTQNKKIIIKSLKLKKMALLELQMNY